MKLYARPGGWHTHADLECPMLAWGQFEEMRYRRVYPKEVKERHLWPCLCVTWTEEIKVNTITKLEKWRKK